MAGGLGEIGTLGWTRRANGILSRRERWRYMARAARVTVTATPRLLGSRVGVRARHRASIEEGDLRPPDSKLAREAVEECEELMPRTIIEHSYRSYLYARALGELDSVAHDDEVLFVAAMYHDAGAMAPDVSDGGRCFTLEGAELAIQRLDGGGRSREQAEAGGEAITLHINPDVPVEQGAEQHLLHDGVLLDAVGVRAWEIEPEAIKLVRSRHPRLRFTQEGGGLLKAQARAIPACRIAAAFRTGFGAALLLSWRD